MSAEERGRRSAELEAVGTLTLAEMQRMGLHALALLIQRGGCEIEFKHSEIEIPPGDLSINSFSDGTVRMLYRAALNS